MNHHFTTTKAHFDMAGGKVLELYTPEGAESHELVPLQGNMDRSACAPPLNAGVENVSFVRMEATTDLIGGQPFSLENLKQVKSLIEPMGIFLVLDASLISENASMIHQREPVMENLDSRHHPGNDERGGPVLPVGPQELQRARRLHRHQPQRPVRSHPPVAAALRGFLHLRRHVLERNRSRWRWSNTMNEKQNVLLSL